MNYRFITSDPVIMMGKPIITGTRITVGSIQHRMHLTPLGGPHCGATHARPQRPQPRLAPLEVCATVTATLSP
jgi:Protein of unknown function (DUF433)